MKANQQTETPKTRQFNYIICGILCTLFLTAHWGIAVVWDMYTSNDVLRPFAHFPFWLMLGSIGVLLNYIPIAKSKANLISIAGIILTIATTAWFCFGDFTELNGSRMHLGRLKHGLGALTVCYCFTHMSLLTMAHRSDSNNFLLIATNVVIILSGIACLFLFSGLVYLLEHPRAAGDFVWTVLTWTTCMFFVKFAMTIATVVLSLGSSRKG